MTTNILLYMKVYIVLYEMLKSKNIYSSLYIKAYFLLYVFLYNKIFIIQEDV